MCVAAGSQTPNYLGGWVAMADLAILDAGQLRWPWNINSGTLLKGRMSSSRTRGVRCTRSDVMNCSSEVKPQVAKAFQSKRDALKPLHAQTHVFEPHLSPRVTVFLVVVWSFLLSGRVGCVFSFLGRGLFGRVPFFAVLAPEPCPRTRRKKKDSLALPDPPSTRKVAWK